MNEIHFFFANIISFIFFCCSIIMIVYGFKKCINKQSTGNCPNSCLEKNCYKYTVINDDENKFHAEYKSGPCTCEYLNSDGSITTICEHFNIKTNLNAEYFTLLLIGFLLLALSFHICTFGEKYAACLSNCEEKFKKCKKHLEIH